MIAQDNINRANFKVYAATDAECGGLAYVRATTRRTVTPDEAKAIAAQFPMSVGLRAHTFIGGPGATETGEVVLHADLCPNKSHQGVNEDGVKRYRAFRKHASASAIRSTTIPATFNALPMSFPLKRILRTSFGLFASTVRGRPRYGIRRRPRSGPLASARSCSRYECVRLRRRNGLKGLWSGLGCQVPVPWAK